jgi:hypothetical protein
VPLRRWSPILWVGPTAANLELILEKRRNTQDAETVKDLEAAKSALRAQADDL